MKILLISLGLGLTFAGIFPAILGAITNNPTAKVVLFYGGVIILLGGLGGVADWLEDKEHNNQDSIET